MRLPCPFCGERDAHEFVYRGDASPSRPAPEEGQGAFLAYVYERDNPAGVLHEHWYHAYGCRNWIVAVRDTRTHEILGAVLAKDFRR